MPPSPFTPPAPPQINDERTSRTLCPDHDNDVRWVSKPNHYHQKTGTPFETMAEATDRPTDRPTDRSIDRPGFINAHKLTAETNTLLREFLYSDSCTAVYYNSRASWEGPVKVHHRDKHATRQHKTRDPINTSRATRPSSRTVTGRKTNRPRERETRQNSISDQLIPCLRTGVRRAGGR